MSRIPPTKPSARAIHADPDSVATRAPQRPVNLANIPEELRRRNQWMPYRIIDGETVFYDLHTGLPVDDPSDPRHWCSFEDVQQAVAPEGGQL